MRRLLIPILILSAATCFSFVMVVVIRPEPFFKVGNKLEYMVTSENGAKSYSEIRIKSVDTDGGTSTIVAEDHRFDDQHKSTFTYRMSYYSDSMNWCVDALNHLNALIVYSSNYLVDLKSDSLVYPYTMKVGDTLNPASASEILRSTLVNERHVRFINRKVVAAEKIAVAGETLQAFRIECKMISTNIADYGQLGKIPTENEYVVTEWFVPSKGVVKSEMKSKTGVTSFSMTTAR